jgi:hypothetical protein
MAGQPPRSRSGHLAPDGVPTQPADPEAHGGIGHRYGQFLRRAELRRQVEQGEQLLYVGEVEAGSRLVGDVDAALHGHRGGQLEPLPLADGQRRERPAEAEVGEPDVGEPVEDGVRGRRARLAGAGPSCPNASQQMNRRGRFGSVCPDSGPQGKPI